MFGDVWRWAGTFRHENLNIGSPWHQVPMQLQHLLDDLTSWGAFGMPLLEQAARLHHRAAQIHPFPNGNGRWSRMLANIGLRLHGYPPTA